jgi:hypothetical protein
MKQNKKILMKRFNNKQVIYSILIHLIKMLLRKLVHI